MSLNAGLSRAQLVQDEMQSILEELRLLDIRVAEQFAREMTRKAELLRTLNRVRPPIGQLPAEILSAIFKMVSPPPISFDEFSSRVSRREEYSPLILLPVSAFWRGVAASTSSLWTSFRLSLPPKEKFPLAIFLLYLKNSANLPIRVEIDYSRHHVDQGTLFDPLVDHDVIPHLPRIHTLKLVQPPAAWEGYMSKLSSMVDLVVRYPTITLELTRGNLFLDECYNLRRLSLISMESAECEIKLRYRMPGSLTVLHLFDIPLDTALEILCRCPDIVELRLGGVDDPHRELEDDAQQTWFGQPVVFRRLEFFEWYFPILDTVWDWMDAFLNVAQMPALQNLAITDDHSWVPRNVNAAILEEFFRRLTRTVTTLRLDGVEDFTRETSFCYPSFFTLDSAVETISINHYNVDILDGLIAKLDPNTSTGMPMTMPKLRALTLSGQYKAKGPKFSASPITKLDEFKAPQFEFLLEVLGHRLVGGDSFHLGFSGTLPYHVDGVLKRLGNLEGKGVKLEIESSSH